MRDLLPEHRPVAAEVAGDVGPGVTRGEARAPVRRRRRVGVVFVALLRLLGVFARLLLQPRRDEARSSTAISAIMMIPPTYSARANCQPIRTQSTSPSSQTRLVEANWKASAVAAEAPFWKSDLAIAIAA